MKANKVTVELKVEVLDIHSVKAMLYHAAEQIGNEVKDGNIRMTDGDEICWETTNEKVEF